MALVRLDCPHAGADSLPDRSARLRAASRVQRLLDALALHAVNMPTMACLFVGKPGGAASGELREGEYGVAPSTVYAVVVVGFALTLLGAPALLLVSWDRRDRRDWDGNAAARLECFLTIAYALLFTFTFGAVGDAFATLGVQGTAQNAGEEKVYLGSLGSGAFTYTHATYAPQPLPASVYVGVILALALLCLQLFLAVRFLMDARAYRRGILTGEWVSFEWGSWKRQATRVFPRQLEQRVAYLTCRFAPHAPLWQFAIWARQLALFAVGIVIKMTLRRLGVTPLAFALRYSLAVIAALILLAAWVVHARVRPFMYEAQNVLESVLILANLLLLAVAVLNEAVIDATTNEEAQPLLELLLYAIVVGTLLGCAYRLCRDLQNARAALGDLDECAILSAAEERIERPLCEELRGGAIRVIRCSWLLDTFGGAAKMQRRQELPDEAFVPADEAEAMLKRGDRSVLVLSHCWTTPEHPDPLGSTLGAVQHYLRTAPNVRRAPYSLTLCRFRSSRAAPMRMISSSRLCG